MASTCEWWIFYLPRTGDPRTLGREEGGAMKSHDNLVKLAEQAIDEVFGDTSVPQRDTLASLHSLKDLIEMKMECIKGDLRRGGGDGK
jgi:hypothetical protein